MAHTDSSRENKPYSLIPENGNESHQLLHEGTDEEVICYGSKIDYKKTFLYYLCCLLSCGFFVLVGYWRPDWRHKWTHSMCPFQEADSVFIKDQYNRWYPAKILQLVDNTRRENSNGKQMIHETNDDPTDALGNGTNPLDVKYFKFHCLRYFWNPQIQHFTVLRGLDRNFTCREIYDRFSRGLDNHQAGRRAIIYEQNLIDVKVKSYIRLLFEVALNPFYVFQVFSVTLWFFDDYYYYAGCIVFVSVVSIAITLVQTRRNRVRLRNMVATSSNIQVIRNHSGDPENVSSTEIVPGDVIVIPPDGIRMECDAVLISGSCVVNESSLTGESNPVLKTQLISDGADADNVYYPNLHKQHSLFAGTQVLQARSYSSSLVTALVIRTGFYSMKGNLVRSILYPKPMNLKLYRDAIGFVGCLAFLALIGLIYSIVTLIIDGVTPGEVIKRALDMITIAVPPALPAAVSIGTVYATNRLRVRGIFCINPSRYLLL
ncbi:putative cation-transporting ATPase 13A3 [Trichoplax sp. H2]|nr:putative cation-transporting ATPase 13A3 [Trichoplax sp. H2]|eukprot:RDD43251.1 putative cation-transporting ATPase 13A3 [Trichoplax sp. H2]